MGNRALGFHLWISWSHPIGIFRYISLDQCLASNGSYWAQRHGLHTDWKRNRAKRGDPCAALVQNDIGVHSNLLHRNVISSNTLQRKDSCILHNGRASKKPSHLLHPRSIPQVYPRWLPGGLRLRCYARPQHAEGHIQDHSRRGLLGHPTIWIPYGIYALVQRGGSSLWSSYRPCYASNAVLDIYSGQGLGSGQ